MSCQFPAICKVVARPVGKHLFPVNAVRRLRRRFRRNSATLAQRGSRSVRLCDKNRPFVTSGRYAWQNFKALVALPLTPTQIPDYVATYAPSERRAEISQQIVPLIVASRRQPAVCAFRH
jgi:hypothetical protein